MLWLYISWGKPNPTLSSSMAMAMAMAMTMAAFTPLKISQPSFFGTRLFCPFSPSIAAPSPPCLRIQASKVIQGTVVCASNDKTASVLVTRFSVHPKYKKRIKSSKKYHAHDAENKCKKGDIVTLAKCSPVSKTKKFLVLGVVQGRVKRNLPVEKLDLPLESEAQPL